MIALLVPKNYTRYEINQMYMKKKGAKDENEIGAAHSAWHYTSMLFGWM